MTVAIVLPTRLLFSGTPPSDRATYLASLLGALVFLGYFVFFEASSGSTPGKRALGLKVVMQDGSPATVGAALTRRLWFVAGSIVPGPVGSLVTLSILVALLLTALTDAPFHQGFHDRLASTRVIRAGA